ncbi:hypothetical protein FB451DRAFT_1525585 [Mycena latifolia]|nr:hypothetical protein FB451DRAFT_1525585 [Mycena latifolia]
MGYVDVFETIEIGGDRVTVLRQLPSKSGRTKTATIVLQGATANRLDDLERAVDDGVNVLKGLIKDGCGCRRDGAGEAGGELQGRIEGAPAAWCQAVCERTLCVAEGNEVLSRLWVKHEAQGGEAWGVDVEVNEMDGTLDAASSKIYDSLASKSWAIRLATETAVSVLSVDSIIMSKPAGGPNIPQSGNWDNDD